MPRKWSGSLSKLSEFIKSREELVNYTYLSSDSPALEITIRIINVEQSPLSVLIVNSDLE